MSAQFNQLMKMNRNPNWMSGLLIGAAGIVRFSAGDEARSQSTHPPSVLFL
jgi:hypothetical protein